MYENKKIELSYKRRCSLKQIIGERKSLKVLLEMCEMGLKLLNYPTRLSAMEYFSTITPKPSYYCYIEEIIFELLK